MNFGIESALKTFNILKKHQSRTVLSSTNCTFEQFSSFKENEKIIFFKNFKKKRLKDLTKAKNKVIIGAHPWRDGRVVEGARLESVFTLR